MAEHGRNGATSEATRWCSDAVEKSDPVRFFLAYLVSLVGFGRKLSYGSQPAGYAEVIPHIILSPAHLQIYIFSPAHLQI